MLTGATGALEVSSDGDRRSIPGCPWGVGLDCAFAAAGAASIAQSMPGVAVPPIIVLAEAVGAAIAHAPR
jgi:hypothetical protein